MIIIVSTFLQMTNITNLRFFNRTVFSTSEVERNVFAEPLLCTCRDCVHSQADIFIDPAKQQSAVVLQYPCYLLEKKRFCTGRHYVWIKMNLIQINVFKINYSLLASYNTCCFDGIEGASYLAQLQSYHLAGLFILGTQLAQRNGYTLHVDNQLGNLHQKYVKSLGKISLFSYWCKSL